MKKHNYNVLNSVFTYMGGTNGIIFILYATFVFCSYVYVSRLNMSFKYTVRWFFIVFLICCAICPLVLRKLRSLKIDTVDNADVLQKTDIKFIIIVFISCFLVFLLHFISFYPGGFWGDQMGQYTQAVTNNYEDWHPAIHTMLFYKIPLLISFGWSGSIALFQIVIFSSAITYAAYVIKVNSNKKIAIVFLLFVLLNPATGNMAIQAYKDTAFAIFALVLAAMSMQIICSSGKWLKKRRNIVILVFIVSLLTLFRHNAILFTVPYVFALMFYMSPKKSIVVGLAVITIVTLIKLPLYSVMNVSKAGNRQVEMLGLPMCVIGAAVKYNPDSLDEEVLDFAYEVAPKKVWEEKYTYGDFNSVKWAAAKSDVIESYGAKKIVGFMAKCFRSSPRESINAIIKLTDPVYSLEDDFSYYETVGIADNEFDIQSEGIPILKTIKNKYLGFAMMIFPHLFMYVGSMMMLLVMLVLAKCRFNKLLHWKRFLFTLPVFSYNFGTMLLLTGASDSSRFFYYTFLVVPVLSVLLLLEKGCENEL